MCPPLGFPLAWLSIFRFNLPAVWREWDGEGGSPRVWEWGPKLKMAQHSAVLPGFWMAGEGSKQAGRRRRARDASGKWKVESGPEPLTRSLRSTQLPDRARVASCELRVAGWGTHHPPTGAVSSSLEMAHGFFKNTPARDAARNANFSFPLF